MNTRKIKQKPDGPTVTNAGRKTSETSDQTKNLLISSIENLSNEIFYEIFEYLDFSDTYHAFSNLNSRFHQLIMSSSLLVNFFVPNRPKFDMEYYCEHIIITNRHRIIALRNLTSPLIEKLLTQCFIDESFSRLENLTFYRVLIKEISPILPYLNLLPRLSSLTISINQFEDPDLDRIDLNGIYEMVFDLPVLKYFDFNPSHGICSGFNDSETTEKLSTIESLTLGHYFSVDVLISFLKRTPRLRHLTCASLYDTPDRIDNDVPLVLPNLTYLWIYYCTVPLDELQHTVKKHFSQLHVFRINTFHNESYIDPDRWKPLIVQTMPQLRRFHFTYNLHWNDNFIDDHFDSFVHHFSSSSWLRRDFMVRLHVTSGFINYSLQSNGNWQRGLKELIQSLTVDNGSISHMRPQDNDIHQNPATIHLSVVYQNDPWSASFMNSMRFILSAIPITSLDIGLHKMPLSLFIKVICSLPNLLELKVHELSFDQRDSLSIEEKEDLDNYSISNKVTSVSHSAERHLTPFLMNLCPRMECFEMFCKSSEIPEAYVRYILTKTITDVPKLHLLKLWIYKANDQTILKLQHLIDSEKLLDNYIIKRWEYYLILKWKLNEKDEFCFRF